MIRFFKNTCVFIIISFSLINCTYDYVETGCPEIGEEYIDGTKTTIKIQAISNTDAQRKAQDLFLERRVWFIKNADDLITGKVKTYAKSNGDAAENDISPIPFSYELKRKGKILSSSVWASHQKNLGGEAGENNLAAFAGAEFGMTPYEVSQITRFSDYVWLPGNQVMAGYENIGLSQYYVQMYFEKNRLFQVELMSLSAFSNSETFISDIRNLRNVFWRAYGKPSYYSSIPTFHLSLQSITHKIGDAAYGIDYPYHSVFEWERMNKKVCVGFAYSDGCHSVATITSQAWIRQVELANKHAKEENERQKKALEVAIEEQINNSSELFK